MQTEERAKLTKTAQRLRRYRETAAAAAVLEEKMAGLRETAAAYRRIKAGAAERAHLRASYRQTAIQLGLCRTETRQVERALAECRRTSGAHRYADCTGSDGGRPPVRKAECRNGDRLPAAAERAEKDGRTARLRTDLPKNQMDSVCFQNDTAKGRIYRTDIDHACFSAERVIQ